MCACVYTLSLGLGYPPSLTLALCRLCPYPLCYCICLARSVLSDTISYRDMSSVVVVVEDSARVVPPTDIALQNINTKLGY